MKIIAIAGHARSGKDSLYGLISKLSPGKTVIRLAFADVLKNEVDSFLKETTGISSWTTDTNEKSIIRPFLVFWGTEFRRQHDPAYWIHRLEERMKEILNEIVMFSSDVTFVITDLRFENEYHWVKERGGTTLYLDRILEDGSLLQAPNPYELENNAILKEKADHVISALTYKSEEEYLEFGRSNLLPLL
jgi:hypothetical protein